MPDYPTIEACVGNTPLVRLQRLPGHTSNTILAKLEGNNPAGSVKDRPALSMIAEAEARGAISPGDTLIEATSGNTGIALAMAAAIRGYRLILIMPAHMSLERKQAMSATGAQMLAALALGAEGVEMGTRFVASIEAQAHAAYKQALTTAQPADTMLIKRSLGMPGRVLQSPHAHRIVAAEADGTAKEALIAMIRGELNAVGTEQGDLENSYVWAGQCVGLIDQVEPAGAIIHRMAAEAAAGMQRLRGLVPA